MNLEQRYSLYSKDNTICQMAYTNGISRIFDKEFSWYKVQYHTRIIEDIVFGLYWDLDTDEKCNPTTIKAGELVSLTKSGQSNLSKAYWLLQPNLDGRYHPTKGMKLIFGDDEIMKKLVYVNKKWL